MGQYDIFCTSKPEWDLTRRKTAVEECSGWVIQLKGAMSLVCAESDSAQSHLGLTALSQIPIHQPEAEYKYNQGRAALK